MIKLTKSFEQWQAEQIALLKNFQAYKQSLIKGNK